MAVHLSIAALTLSRCDSGLSNQPMITHAADFFCRLQKFFSILMFCRGCVSVLEVEINKGDQS